MTTLSGAKLRSLTRTAIGANDDSNHDNREYATKRIPAALPEMSHADLVDMLMEAYSAGKANERQRIKEKLDQLGI